jgi:AcrR family transcriptional regulator
MIEVALELVDELGAGALNMRILAERLGTGTATLYRHVSGREELLVHVVDRVLAEDLEPGSDRETPPGWQEAARRIAFRFRATLSRHPNVLPLLVAQLPNGPHALRVREQSLAALMRFGLSPELAARSYNALAVYVIGSCAVEPAERSGGVEAAALGDYYRSLNPDVYPSTVAAAAALTGGSPQDEFAEGLGFIIDGIDRARRRRDRRSQG